MKDLVYLSRAFVEFGPFSKKEILDFQKRGILSEADYLRDHGSDHWLHYQEWLTVVPMPAPKLIKKAAPAAKAAAKPTAKKGKKAA